MSGTSATRGFIVVREAGISQLTRDHSLLEDYKEAKPDMTEEEERNFPHKNVITRALGMRETVQVDIRSHQIKSGDVYILWLRWSVGHGGRRSDLSDRVEREELERARRRAGGCGEPQRRLQTTSRRCCCSVSRRNPTRAAMARFHCTSRYPMSAASRLRAVDSANPE